MLSDSTPCNSFYVAASTIDTSTYYSLEVRRAKLS